MNRLRSIFKKAFLPHGYPYSVSRDYASYQIWDSAQAFASSIMNILATHAVLKGVGVGDENATVLAATTTFILRDGTSIIGSLVFATINCYQMDANCKRWRLFADILNDVAIFIDLLSSSIVVGGAFQFQIIQCFSGLFRSLVGIAGGATRAALTQHQAINNNMADVSAKDNSQERIVNLMALAVGYLIVPYVSGHVYLIWWLYVLFTIMHIYANYRAVKTIHMDIFNAHRLAIFFERFTEREGTKAHSMSVENINRAETVWFFNPFDSFDYYFDNIKIIVKPAGEALNFDDLDLVEIYGDPSGRYHVTIPKFSKIKTSKAKLPIKVFINEDLDQDENHGERCSQIIEILFMHFFIMYALRSQTKIRESLVVQDTDKILSGVPAEKQLDVFHRSIGLDFELADQYTKASSKLLFQLFRELHWKTSHLQMPEIIEMLPEILDKKRQ